MIAVPIGPRSQRFALAASPSYLAAEKYLAALGLHGRLTAHGTFQEAVSELLAGAADLAFLPIENTSAGSTRATGGP